MEQVCFCFPQCEQVVRSSHRSSSWGPDRLCRKGVALTWQSLLSWYRGKAWCATDGMVERGRRGGVRGAVVTSPESPSFLVCSSGNLVCWVGSAQLGYNGLCEVRSGHFPPGLVMCLPSACSQKPLADCDQYVQVSSQDRCPNSGDHVIGQLQ